MAAMLMEDLTTVFLYRIVDGRRVLAGFGEVNGETALLVVEPDAKDQPEVEDVAMVMVRKYQGTVNVQGYQMKKYHVFIVRIVAQAQVA